MNSISAASLSDLFPHFYFAGAAESYLGKVAMREIDQQLLERRIADVSVNFIPTQGGLGIDEKHFFVVLNKNLSLHEQAESLGHEIAHTFHYNLTYTPPKNILKVEYEIEMELFCEEFSARWLELNTLQKVQDWLERKLTFYE